jgi:hypothetical protein
MYKCKVYDSRENNVFSNGTQNEKHDLGFEIEIPVYVAETLADTCEENEKAGIVWPRTKKV